MLLVLSTPSRRYLSSIGVLEDERSDTESSPFLMRFYPDVMARPLVFVVQRTSANSAVEHLSLRTGDKHNKSLGFLKHLYHMRRTA